MTHVCQTVTHVQPASAEEPPPPLEDLQIELPPDRPTTRDGGGSQLQERSWARALRMDAASATSGTTQPLVALQLAGSLWKLRVRALPALAGRSEAMSAAMSDSAGATSAGILGNGAGSTTPSASPRTPTATPGVLPRSELERVRIPAVEAGGLRCVRMFWNVLVGDVVLGLLGDGSGFSSDGGAIAAVGPLLREGRSSGDGEDADRGFDDAGPNGRASGQAQGGGPAADADDADGTALQVERSMRMVYQLEPPQIPRVEEGVPEDAVGASALKALDEGVTALIASGVAHCEHMHVRLMERFKIVAGRVDGAAEDADIRDVQAAIDDIMDRNKELQERVTAAASVSPPLRCWRRARVRVVITRVGPGGGDKPVRVVLVIGPAGGGARGSPTAARRPPWYTGPRGPPRGPPRHAGCSYCIPCAS